MKKTLPANDIKGTNDKPPGMPTRRRKKEEKPKEVKPPRILKKRKKDEKPKGEKRGFYLRSARDIRRMLSRLINRTVNGEIEESLLRVVSYSSTVFLKSLEIGELTDQLKQLASDVEELKQQMEEKKC